MSITIIFFKEVIDLIYEGITTIVPTVNQYQSREEVIDLIYEGITTK